MRIELKDADEFNELMIRKGFTKRGLAQAADISHAMVVLISKGERSPRANVAARIVEALGIEFDDAFKIVRTKSPQNGKVVS